MNHSIGRTSIAESVHTQLCGKRVMVTGACGTVGQNLIQQLIETFDIGSLTGMDNNESGLTFLDERFRGRDTIRFRLCDIRDLPSLIRETRKVDVLFHAAAYKHVYMCERSPLEAIQTNVLGVQNIIQAATENGLERLVFTSSDKAVNPTNVMGTSKLMGERLITAAALHPDHSGALFLSTRFGNVLGSRGSVIPIFRDQIRRGGPVTLSDPQMTRFIMSLEQATRLVIESIAVGRPGDVLITKMPAIRISDLAEVMVRELAPRYGHRPQDIEIRVSGQRPGEKLYEELMNEEETRRSWELEQYYVVTPALASPGGNQPAYESGHRVALDRPYNTRNVEPLSQHELAEFLHRNALIDELESPRGRTG